MDFSCKKGTQNEAEIDAKIIQSRFWVARGAADVDFDYFLVAFGEILVLVDFSSVAQNRQNQEKPGHVAPGRGRTGHGGRSFPVVPWPWLPVYIRDGFLHVSPQGETQ